jgi:hypothetical protein
MTTVSQDKWRDAVKFLMNLGTGPNLSAKDQRFLRGLYRGPFTNGMSELDALRVLGNAGWLRDRN